MKDRWSLKSPTHAKMCINDAFVGLLFTVFLYCMCSLLHLDVCFDCHELAVWAIDTC
jgi:hypothetical protein